MSAIVCAMVRPLDVDGRTMALVAYAAVFACSEYVPGPDRFILSAVRAIGLAGQSAVYRRGFARDVLLGLVAVASVASGHGISDTGSAMHPSPRHPWWSHRVAVFASCT